MLVVPYTGILIPVHTPWNTLLVWEVLYWYNHFHCYHKEFYCSYLFDLILVGR